MSEKNVNLETKVRELATSLSEAQSQLEAKSAALDQANKRYVELSYDYSSMTARAQEAERKLSKSFIRRIFKR